MLNTVLRLDERIVRRFGGYCWWRFAFVAVGLSWKIFESVILAEFKSVGKFLTFCLRVEVLRFHALRHHGTVDGISHRPLLLLLVVRILIVLVIHRRIAETSTIRWPLDWTRRRPSLTLRLLHVCACTLASVHPIRVVPRRIPLKTKNQTSWLVSNLTVKKCLNSRFDCYCTIYVEHLRRWTCLGLRVSKTMQWTKKKIKLSVNW